MNTYLLYWLYLLVSISFVYWFVVAVNYTFPQINPIIVSLIATAILYFVSNQQSLILLV